jgi:hypothetical protein
VSDDPRRVRESLTRVSRDLGIADPDVFAIAAREWPRIVGDAVAAHAHLRHLRAGVLTVAVDDGAWASQLRYLERDVVRGLARAGIDVDQVRITVTRGGRG